MGCLSQDAGRAARWVHLTTRRPPPSGPIVRSRGLGRGRARPRGGRSAGQVLLSSRRSSRRSSPGPALLAELAELAELARLVRAPLRRRPSGPPIWPGNPAPPPPPIAPGPPCPEPLAPTPAGRRCRSRHPADAHAAEEPDGERTRGDEGRHAASDPGAAARTGSAWGACLWWSCQDGRRGCCPGAAALLCASCDATAHRRPQQTPRQEGRRRATLIA